MRGRDFDWYREVINNKRALTGGEAGVYITRNEKRRADDRHEGGCMLGCVLIVLALTYLFFFY